MAIADGALFGFKSLDDLQKQEIPPGKNELILQYNESVLDRPILRKCTKADGVTDEPMPKSAFLANLREDPQECRILLWSLDPRYPATTRQEG